MRTILLFFWLERWQCSKAKDRYSSAAELATDVVSTVPTLCLAIHPPLRRDPKVSGATMYPINTNGAGLLCTGAQRTGVLNGEHCGIAPSVAADHKRRATKDTGLTTSQLRISPLVAQLSPRFTF